MAGFHFRLHQDTHARRDVCRAARLRQREHKQQGVAVDRLAIFVASSIGGAVFAHRSTIQDALDHA
jgi:hypothetical protein